MLTRIYFLTHPLWLWQNFNRKASNSNPKMTHSSSIMYLQALILYLLPAMDTLFVCNWSQRSIHAVEAFKVLSFELHITPVMETIPKNKYPCLSRNNYPWLCSHYSNAKSWSWKKPQHLVCIARDNLLVPHL